MHQETDPILCSITYFTLFKPFGYEIPALDTIYLYVCFRMAAISYQ